MVPLGGPSSASLVQYLPNDGGCDDGCGGGGGDGGGGDGGGGGKFEEMRTVFLCQTVAATCDTRLQIACEGGAVSSTTGVAKRCFSFHLP
jgi:hypothetical protein